jgi:hypothetical protein
MPRPKLKLAHPPPKPAPPLLPLSALVDPITAAEAEEQLGSQNVRWQEMKVQMQPGDELWWYCTVLESKTGYSSRHGGIALARQGKVIAKIGTRIFRVAPKKG